MCARASWIHVLFLTGWEMICLFIFLLAAGFGDTRNPFNASLPIWLHLNVGHFQSQIWMLFSLFPFVKSLLSLLSLGRPVACATEQRAQISAIQPGSRAKKTRKKRLTPFYWGGASLGTIKKYGSSIQIAIQALYGVHSVWV